MLTLPAELTHTQAGACLQTLLPGLRGESAATLQVDASPLQQFDSTALAVLLECRRVAASLGKPLAVVGMPERLRALATLYGVDSLLPAV